jgi:hypothetical protein
MSDHATQPHPPRDLALSGLMAGLGFTAGAGGTLAVGWLLSHHLAGWPDLSPAGLWDWVHWSAGVWLGDAPGTGDWLPWLRVSGGLAAAVGSVVAGMAYRYAGPPAGEQHLRGRQLSTYVQHCARAMRDEAKLSGAGIKLHPSATISLDRETRGFLILGSIGGGKTQIINHLLQQIIARGDKCLIFDNKADFTSGLLGGESVALFAPWDSRGIAWNVAVDCVTKPDAEELAARLVPESNDPMWSNGARQILAALIINAQRSAPGAWTFADIAEAAGQEYEQLRAVCLSADPKLHLLLPDKPTKTTQSFLSQLVVFMSQVFSLADAWSDAGHGEPTQRFSLRNWLLAPDSSEQRTKILIMQAHGRYQKLAQAYIQSLISALASIVNSPDLPDSQERRVWLILDEFPQLGRIESIEKFVEIGRSKGIRTILAAQDINQIRAAYGNEWANALSSMVGTTIACRTQGAETPQWLSSLIGDRQVKRYSPTLSAPIGSMGGYAAAPQRTDNWITANEPVVSPDEFGLLGPGDAGVTALLISGSSFVYKLVWPFTKLPGSALPTLPAPWTQPGWPSSADQAAQTLASVEIEEGPSDASNTAPPVPRDNAQPTSPPARNPVMEAEQIGFNMLPLEIEPEAEPSKAEADENPAGEALKELAADLDLLPEPISIAVDLAEAIDQLQPPEVTATAPVPIAKKIKVRRRKTIEQEREQC